MTPPPLLPIRSLLNNTYPVNPDSASVISMLAPDSVVPIMRGLISSSIMFNSFFLFIMLLSFKPTHLYPASETYCTQTRPHSDVQRTFNHKSSRGDTDSFMYAISSGKQKKKSFPCPILEKGNRWLLKRCK